MTNASIPDKFYRVAIKAIIKDDKGRILLVKERSDQWSIPGGGLDYGEDAKTAIKREVSEELGLITTHIEERPSFVFSNKNVGFGVWCFSVCYKVQTADIQFNLGDGVTEAHFYSAEQIKKLGLEDADKPLIEFI